MITQERRMRLRRRFAVGRTCPGIQVTRRWWAARTQTTIGLESAVCAEAYTLYLKDGTHSQAHVLIALGSVELCILDRSPVRCTLRQANETLARLGMPTIPTLRARWERYDRRGRE